MIPTLPEAMRSARQWIVWKSIPNPTPGKKPRKVPFYVSGVPRNGALDSPGDLAQLSTLSAAMDALGTGQYAGLGFALSQGWQGIDLDDITSRPALAALQAELTAGTYCELSPSGNGIHAIGYGAAFQAIGSGADGIEAYSSGRYFTVTGMALNTLPAGDLAPYVEQRLRPIRGVPAVAPRAPMVYEERTDADLDELRDALRSIPADDRDVWVAMGNALCRLGDDGYALWMEWSATSPKHDPGADTETWCSFSGDRTGFAAVFAKAQSLGWVNPKARKPLDTTTIGFGERAVPPATTGVPIPPRAAVVQPTARVITGSRLVTPQQQMEHLFNGCVYIGSENKILIPGGWLLDRQRFDNMTGGFSFIMNNENQGSPSKSAWEAFLLNQAYDSPRAETTCFRPELPPGVIVREGGQRAANTWWPIDTVRTPGDVTPFLDYLTRVLPDERDRLLLTSYMAAMVQYPGVKFQWCPVVQGAKGNGKTLIGTALERALGDRYCHRPNSADIGNKFTGWLRGKLAIIVEELSTHEKRELLETLKPLITNRRVEIQNKGADQSTGDNRANFIMFVNGKGDMPIDANERRYGLFHMAQQEYADIVRDGMSGEYFPNLFKWADGGGYECISHYLATFAIPDEMNPAGKLHRAPRTSSTDDAIAHSLGPMEQELLEVIDGNATPGMMNGWLSGAAVKKAMTDAGRKTSPQSRARCLKALGYVLHPHLPEGRSPVITFVDGCRPKLYVRAESELCQIEPVAAVIAAYLAAQVAR